MKRLGILGGGQLARMMLPHCIAWNIPISVLDRDNCVCKNFCRSLISGDFSNSEDVFQAYKDRDVVTMDLEAVSLEGLKRLEAAGVEVAPSSQVIETIQNKVKQKSFFLNNDIPTMEFEVLDRVTQETPHGFLKLPEGGYDGKGVISFKGDVDSLPEPFKQKVLWEKPADMEREISLLVVRNKSGEVKTYDATEMAFDPRLNLIAYTLYPARISPEENQEAKNLATKVVEKMGAVGVFAVEMFQTKTGELFVNECAPRPHNSGHHTIESSLTSQFENHLRGVLNLPLGSTDRKSMALTFNVIGEGDGKAVWEGEEYLLATEGAFLHNYGKENCKPGRKMGHVTLTGQSYQELLSLYEKCFPKIRVKGE